MFFIGDIQDVHGPVPDIRKEIRTFQFTQTAHDGRVSLWIQGASDQADVVILMIEAVTDLRILEKIRTEFFPLVPDPG